MPQVEQFGKYILLEKLATGGMAEVYLAKSTGANGVNKFLAIKRILPQYFENQDFIEMFKEEAKIAVNLNHSNVVSIFDFGVERKQFFLVMEYVEGRNLRQIINELKKNNIQFTIEQIVYMIKEVAAGLDHAHRCIDGSTGRPLNITHRDMSPQNIMLSFEGEVKIIDFGIAKAETQIEATKAGTLKGKFGYMSPEQAEGHQVDLRTDIFSLGIVLWELLANDRLFTASSEAAILRKIRECQIPSIRKINPSVPPELERIVNKALQKDKTLRYQTAAAMHRDLNRFLNTQYPEFTPHDFSVFIKNAFSNSYQEQKRKLIDFAKIQFDESLSAGTRTVHDAVPSADTELDGENNFLPSETFDPSRSGLKVNLDGIRESIDRKTIIGKVQGGTNSEIRRGSQYRIQAPTTTRRYRSVQSDIPWDKILPVAYRAGAALAVVGLVIYLIKATPDRYFSPSYWANQVKAALVQEDDEDSQHEMASKVEYFVTIHSNPVGAEVKLNGKGTGLFTPAQIKVEGNKPFHLTLLKDKFFPYERELTADRDAITFNATLLPMPNAGYITINLVAGGESPIIEVNGQRLGEKPPIVNYPVPAGVPITVKARNPFSGTYAEQTVTVGNNQKRTVEMILKVDPRNQVR